MNLAQLRTEVLNHGFDPVEYSPRITQYLDDAQKRIARKVDYYTDQTTSNFTTTAGTVAYSWPTNLARLQDVFDDDRGLMLQYAETRAMDNSDPTVTGAPYYYTVQGSGVRLYPIPDGDYNLTLRYWKLPSTLVTDAQTPSIPGDYQDMLIFWALSRAFASEDDAQMSQFWEQKFDKRLSEFSADQKFPSTDGPMVARGMWEQDPSLDSGGLAIFYGPGV